MRPEPAMAAALPRPVNQRRRIAVLRLVFATLLPLLVLTQSRWTASPAIAALLQTLGILAILVAVLGRFWAILYIGGRKNAVVMRDGPYSLCRHPLYLFSTLGVAGFGLALASLTLALVLGGTAWLILSLTAAREERFLSQSLGAQYARYMQDVPRMWPALRRFRTPAQVSFDTATLARNAADALVFISLIPLAALLRGIGAMHLLPTLMLF